MIRNIPNGVDEAAKPLYQRIRFSNPGKYEDLSCIGGYVTDDSTYTADRIPRPNAIVQGFYFEINNGANSLNLWISGSYNALRRVIGRNRQYTLQDYINYMSDAMCIRFFRNSINNMVRAKLHDATMYGEQFWGVSDIETLETTLDELDLLCDGVYPLPKNLADWVDKYCAIGVDTKGEYYQDMYWIPKVIGFTYNGTLYSEVLGSTIVSVMNSIAAQAIDAYHQIASDLLAVVKVKEHVSDNTCAIHAAIKRHMNTVFGCTGQSGPHAPLTFAWAPSKDLSWQNSGVDQNSFNYYVDEVDKDVDVLDIFYHSNIDYAAGSSGDSDEYYAIVGTRYLDLITSAGSYKITAVADMTDVTPYGIKLISLILANNDLLGGITLKFNNTDKMVAPCLPAFIECIPSVETTVHKDVWINAIRTLFLLEFHTASETGARNRRPSPKN